MATMNMGEEADIRFQCEATENDFTPNEIEELLSLFLVKKDNPLSPASDSQGSHRTTTSANDDERKLRRMISNRESARRSRWRKKRHLEDLKNELNQLLIENRELKDRLGRVLNCCNSIQRENDLLWIESMGLGSKLSDLCRNLAAVRSDHLMFL